VVFFALSYVNKLKVVVSKITPVPKHLQCAYFVEYVFSVKDQVSHFDYAENCYDYSTVYFSL
jgi:hypothetical protein